MLSQAFLVFLQVVDCGSFSKAAKQLFVTPASVMKHMNALESRLGVTLLKRSNRGIELTAAGNALYKDGKDLLAAAERAVARAKSAALTEGVTIRVGSSLLNPSRVLTDLWAPLREKYPMYKFHIVPYEDTKEQILSVVSQLGDRIDLLVGPSIPRRCGRRPAICIWGNTASVWPSRRDIRWHPGRSLRFRIYTGNIW